MQFTCNRQLAQCQVRPAHSTVSVAHLHSGFTSRVAFQPARIGAPRPQRTIAVVKAADVQAAPIDVSSLVENDNKAREGVAKLSFQRGSVFKVRRILDVLRGRSYEEALAICEYMPYRACELVTKVLMSAAANAKHNAGAMKAKLYVSEAFADQGPWLKRFRPRAQGRAFKRLKGTYHLTIRLSERE